MSDRAAIAVPPAGGRPAHRPQAARRLASACLALLSWASATHADVLIPPRTNRAVLDKAGVILPEDRRAMEALADRVRGKTNVSILVVTLKALDGEPIEELGRRWGRAWGLGGTGQGPGVLFLVALADGEARIENRFGVAGYITDQVAAEILEEEAGPCFDRGDHSTGIRRAVERLARVTARQHGADLGETLRGGIPRSVLTGGALVLALILGSLLVAGGLPALLFRALLGGRRPGRDGGDDSA